jgi:hypothetical protein
MRSQQEGWFKQLFSRISATERNYQDVISRLNQLQQQMRTIPAGAGPGGGGGMQQVCWCRTPGSVSAATGSWPSLTPATFSADIYQDTGGTLTQVASSATVRWFYKDTAAANKLVPCFPNPDGTYDAVAESCTAV